MYLQLKLQNKKTSFVFYLEILSQTFIQSVGGKMAYIYSVCQSWEVQVRVPTDVQFLNTLAMLHDDVFDVISIYL